MSRALACLAAVLGACEAPSGPIEVKSSDGNATLTIPAGALPSGVSKSQVKVTALGAGDFTLLQGAKLIAGYRLEPDGIALSRPARLRIRLPEAIAAGTQLSHLSATDMELLDLVTIVGDGGAATEVEAELRHFSMAQIFDLQDSIVRRTTIVAGPPNTIVGHDTFMTTETVVNAGEARIDGPMGFSSVYQWSQPDWDYATHWSASANLSPRSVVDPFEGAGLISLMPGVDRTQATQIFRCLAEGPFFIENYWFVVQAVKIESFRPDGSSQHGVLDRTVHTHSPKVRGNAFCLKEDPKDDFIDSRSSRTPTETNPNIDIIGYAGARVQVPLESLASPKVDCARPEVVCLAQSLPLDRNFIMIAVKHAAPLPVNDPARSYIYSAVLNENVANGWRAVPPFDWDLFQGASLWLQLMWDHVAQSWSVVVTKIAADQSRMNVASSARARIDADTILWYLNEVEAPMATGFRATAFRHDGNFTEATRAADVSGANPTIEFYSAFDFSVGAEFAF